MRALVAILLRLFPGRFRREFGADLLATFEDRWRERRGWALAARTIADLAGSAVLVWCSRSASPPVRKGDRLMTNLWQDLRYAARTLGKTPGFTAITLITLALGIGANSAIYSVVNAVLIKGLPYPNLDRLVSINEMLPKSEVNVSWPDFVDWQEQNQVFARLAAFQPNSVQFNGGEAPQSIPAGWVTSSLFPLLGATAALGRTFGEEDDRPGAPPVAVVSYRFWRNHLKGEAQALGKTLPMGIGAVTLVGVLAPDFEFRPWELDVYLPIARRIHEPQFTARANHPGLKVIGEIRPGVTLARVRADLNTIMARLAEAWPESNRGETAVVTPLADRLLGDVRKDLLMLLGAVAFVLLIACANVAHLALARAAGRSREFAVRVAIGASRSRLIRQLLAESTLLSFGGGAAGLLLAHWSLPPLIALYPVRVPGLREAGLDWRVVLFTLGLCLLSAALFGLAPVLHAARAGLTPGLKDGSGGAGFGRSGRRMRSALFVAEIAIAIVLAVGSGLLLRSLFAVLSVNPGFQADRLLALDVVHEGGGPMTRHLEFFRQAVDRIARQPGVESASAVMCPPMSGTCWTSPYMKDGDPAMALAQRPWTAMNMVLPGYFQTMRIPLLEGRLLSAADHASSPKVAVVNQAFARLLWPAGSAVGKRVEIVYGGGELEVVGVVGDVKQFGLEPRAMTEAYIPAAQMPISFMTVVVRTAVDPAGLSQPVVAAIREIEKGQAVAKIAPMTRTIAGTLARRKFAALLLGLFGALALVLAVVGVAGIMAYTVAQRTREFGIRIAMGAEPGQVRRLVLKDGLRLTAAGVVLGLAMSWALTRLLTSMLFRVKSHDPVTLAAVAVLLTAAALVACVLPARRAARVDPMTALRWD